MSSPANPIFSLGISRGPSGEPAGAPFGLDAGPAVAVIEDSGASEVPFMRVPMLGTVLPAEAGSASLGGVPIGPSDLREVGGVCFSMWGLGASPLF